MGCLIGGSMVGLMATSSRKAGATRWVTQVCCSQSPCLHGRALLAHASAGDKHTKAGVAQSLGVSASCCTQGFVWVLQASPVSMGFDSKRNFAPPTILLGLLLCPWTWGIFFGGIQHFPANGCSAASCNFGVLAGEDEYTSFYSAILDSLLKEVERKWKSLSCVLLFETPWPIACQAPLSMEFSRPKY